MPSFRDTPGHVRCKHCGCKQSEHRGANPEGGDNWHHCPPTYERGLAKPFPRTTHAEDKSKDYSDYWKRVQLYWATPTTFEAD